MMMAGSMRTGNCPASSPAFMADEKRNTANDTQYYYDVKNEKVLMIFDGMVDGEDNPELIEKIENTIQNYFWSGAGMIEVRKYLT